MPTLRTISYQIEAAERSAAKQKQYVSELWVKFGQCVRSTRHERNISLSQLAKVLGRTPAMLAYMESGDRSWPPSIAKKVIAYMGRPIQWPDAGRAPLTTRPQE